MKLEKEEFESLKQSYFNILALFLGEESVQSKYVACLLKWSAQLNLTQQDLHHIEDNYDKLNFSPPSSRIERLEAIYHLIHMIYLDNIVEDIELELAAIYAAKLGFKTTIVSELFKAIATAPFDGKTTSEVRKEVEDFLEIYDNV